MTGPWNDLDKISNTGESKCNRPATNFIIAGDPGRSALAIELPRQPGQGLSKGVTRATRNNLAQPETY